MEPIFIEHLQTAFFEAIGIDIDDSGVYFGVLILRPDAPAILPIIDQIKIALTNELIGQKTIRVVLETPFNIV